MLFKVAGSVRIELEVRRMLCVHCLYAGVLMSAILHVCGLFLLPWALVYSTSLLA